MRGVTLPQVQRPAFACVELTYIPLCTTRQPLQVLPNGGTHTEWSFLTFNLSFLRCSVLVLLHVALSGTSKNILPPLSSQLVYRHSCGVKDCGDELVYLVVLQTVSNLGLSKSEDNSLKESSKVGFSSYWHLQKVKHCVQVAYTLFHSFLRQQERYSHLEMVFFTGILKTLAKQMLLQKS